MGAFAQWTKTGGTVRSTYPETYGAVGNGSANDTAAWLSAITAAGAGGVIECKPNSTYLIDAPLVLLSGQIIKGNGATIKRANQVSDTTTTTITSGSTNSITVTNGANFRVGQYINILNGTTYNNGGNLQITGISGNVLTLSATFGVSVSGTTTVYVNYDLIKLADDCKIYDLQVNGNRANYAFRRWEVTSEIKDVGSRTRVQSCYFYNVAGECIQQSGASYFANVGCVYAYNRIYNCSGNGFHLSGSDGTVVIGNSMENGNLDTNVGHVSGGVGMSQGFRNFSVIGNVIKNFYTGVGTGTSWVNSFGVIKGNIVYSCSNGPFSIVCGGSSDTNVTDWLIQGNQFFDCGQAYVSIASPGPTSVTPTGTTTSGSSTVTGLSSTTGVAVGSVISGTGIPTNTIIIAVSGTTITLGTITGTPVNATASGTVTLTIAGDNVRRINMIGNSWVRCGVGSNAVNFGYASDILFQGNSIVFDASDTSSTHIAVNNPCSHLSFTGNKFAYGGTGITLASSTPCDDILINNNQFRQIAATNIYGPGAAHTKVLVQGNELTGLSVASGWIGINCCQYMVVKNNVIDVTGSPTCGIYINGNANAYNVVQGNTVRVGSGTLSIRCYGGVSNFVVAENQVSVAVSIGGTAIRNANNDVIW